MTTKADVLNQTYTSLVALQADATSVVDTLTAAATGFTPTTITSNPSYQAVLGDYDKFTETDVNIAAALVALEGAVAGGYTDFSESDATLAATLAAIDTTLGTYAAFSQSDTALANALAAIDIALGTYAAFTQSDGTLATALGAFDTALAGITRGTLPAAPSMTGFTTPNWSETWWTNLKTALSDITGSITNSDDVDTLLTKLTSDTDKLTVALYNSDVERQGQALRDAHSAADSATGAKGFSRPNCMTTALKLAAQQQYMFNCSQTARDLIKTIFAFAKETYQFSIQQGIAAHGTDTEFNLRYADTLIKVYTAQVETILNDFKAQVAAEISKAENAMKGLGFRLDVTKANAAIEETHDRGKFARMEATLKGLNLRLDAAKANAAIDEARDRGKLAVLEGNLKGYSLRLEAIKGNAAIAEASDRTALAQLEAKIREYSLRLDVFKTNALIDSEYDRAAVSAFAENVRELLGLTEQAVKTAAETAQHKILAGKAVVEGLGTLSSVMSTIDVSISNT